MCPSHGCGLCERWGPQFVFDAEVIRLLISRYDDVVWESNSNTKSHRNQRISRARLAMSWRPPMRSNVYLSFVPNKSKSTKSASQQINLDA